MQRNQAAPWPTEHWWTRYDDAVLSQLIQTATVGAPRIELATARIDTAREQVRLAGASQGLNVDVKGSWQRLRLSDNGLLPPEFLGFNWYNQSDLGVEVRYTLDWWGKQRAGIDAALDRARAALVEQRATMLALSAAVAQEYFGWQADSARLALAEQRLQLLQSQQQLAARRVSARLETADTGQQLEQQLAAAEEVQAAAADLAAAAAHCTGCAARRGRERTAAAGTARPAATARRTAGTAEHRPAGPPPGHRRQPLAGDRRAA